MTWTNKVVWSEGLFLRPQLFQQQERYLEDFTHQRCLPLSPLFWGFHSFGIDRESLHLGKLVLSSGKGVFPDGTPFDIPGATEPPQPLTILPEHLEQTIFLALPIRKPNSEETSFDNAASSTARFAVFDSELRDANSVGQGPKSVQLSRLRLRLVPQKELSDAWMGMPLTKVTALQSDGSATLEPNLIPPISRYGASDTITQWLAQLHGTLVLRAQSLASRLAGADGNAAEVSDFLMLQVLNRFEPEFEHILALRETPTVEVYRLMRQLSAELSTFARPNTRRPKSLPAYEHSDPYRSFRDLVEDTRELLNNVLMRSAQNIPLQEGEHGLRRASVDPATLQGFGNLVLAVGAHLSPDQISRLFLAHAKLGPSERLPELVRLHLPGIAFTVLPVPPRQIPFNAGYVYFQVEQRGPLWEQMRQHGGIALHVASDMPGLKLELWGVR